MHSLLHMMMAGVLAAGAAVTALAADPIIEFHTNVYENVGADNSFHIVLGATETTTVQVDCGFGATSVEVNQAIYDADSAAVQGTTIQCTVNEAGIVRVYGDPTKIDYLDAEGCYIDRISFPELTEMEILTLDHNELQALDLSHMTKLQALYLSANPFDVSPLVVGANKPNLTILELSIIDNMDSSFSLRDYPSLVSFEAWNNKGLKVCDPTGCPDLLRLSIDVTDVETLDVSKNPNLLILNIAETRIPSIDVSNNPYLTEFYCGHSGSYNNDVKLTELIVGDKPYLQRFYCTDNLLTDLDISQCPALVSFSCAGNLLPGIDFDANPNLYSVDISRNYMDFATIPDDRSTFGEYYYSQRAMKMDRSYAIGTVLDLSAKVLRPNSDTEVTMYAIDEADAFYPIELDNSYYSYEDGKVTLLKEYADSVYLSFYNSALPTYPLTTAKFKIKSADDYGKDAAIVTLTTSARASELNLGIGMAGASAETPKTFSVDFGDGNPVSFVATTDTIPATCNVSGARKGSKLIIYMPEGEDLTALSIADAPILLSDFTQARSLAQLVINGCSLPKIDLLWNRSLKLLDLSNNSLTALDLSTDNGNYGKNVLSDVRVANNKLDSISFNDHRTLLNLDLSDNRLTTVSLKDMSNLLVLNVANNQLDEISLQDCEALTTLDASGNNLTTIYLPDYTPLESLNISNNDFTLPELPLPGAVAEYVYAPQSTIQLPDQAPSVNLTSQLLDLDGSQTVFEWYKADGTALTAEDIKTDNGRFYFLSDELGKVYCNISHAAFPDFAGANILTTTQVTAAKAPTHVFASFTTTETSDDAEIILTGAEKGTTIYIDWTGEDEYEQYVLAESYTQFPVSTHKGVTVKCYSYDENDGVTVFSISGVAMSEIDASPMKGLIAFTCASAGLTDGSYKLPESPLTELNLSDNELTTVDLSAYNETLRMLNLSSNNFVSLDLSGLKALQVGHIASSGIETIKLDNPILWELNLSYNELETIDLSGTPAMEQLWLSENYINSIDVTGLANLHVLFVDGNCLDFTTLPENSGNYYVYNYYNQRNIAIEAVDMKVDLSYLAEAWGFPTEYRWFTDVPYYDDDYEIVGSELVEGTDFTIEDGITTFLQEFPQVMCLMTNDAFPDLLLCTGFTDVRDTGISTIEADSAQLGGDVYNLQGILVLRAATAEQINALPTGLYIVGGQKVIVK